jgi:hypothetical protein
MPTDTTLERPLPRSALRYRPTNTNPPGPGPTVARQRRSRSADTLATTAPAAPDELDLNEEPRTPRQRRTVPPVPRRKNTAPFRAGRQLHPLFFIGAGLLLVVLLWTGLTHLLAWGTNAYNTIVYGYPRTFQIDAVVGQGDSLQHPSHFIAVNLHGTITIIEFPAGDPTRARELASSSLLGLDADQAVVTLRFVDLNHNGKPDMLITAGGIQSILVNDGKIFRVPTSTEQQQILQELQQNEE